MGSLMHHRGARTTLKVVLLVVVVSVILFKVKWAPSSVVAHKVAVDTVVAEVMGTGTLEARVKTTISPRIQERLAEVLVDQGDPVGAGQMLARLDDGALRQQVEMSAAALAAARATEERVRVDQSRAGAVKEQARLNHTRAKDLLASQVAAQADVDKATEQLQIAEADLRRAQAAIVEAERRVAMAEKTLLYHRERLSYTQILSPYDGLVVRRERDPGGVVVPGGSILQLVSTNEIWISAWVDETASAGLRSGQPARIVFRSEPTRTYRGEVARLGRETDQETREFLVDVRLEELPANWTIGQRAEVFIETGRKTEVLTVPQDFIHGRDGKTGVFVNDGGTARWRAVESGFRGREVIEVAQGLSAGDEVVRSGKSKQAKLTDGQRIAVR
ncbi:MAG TPA: efflux RND transporter periplasmic adaptor subunit [Clostridia bacterium]|nr:efflux RND transporter periplasmic adaptor subunit [Clostridia bacterium]